VSSFVDGDIRLEPLTAEHGAAMDALARDEDVARFTRVPEPVPDGFGGMWVERYMRGKDEGTNAGFAIVDTESDDFLGFVALVKVDLDTLEAEAGYIVASHARGRGVGTRALRVLTAWAFAELPLERIELFVDVANPASEIVARRCGYRREGVLRWTYLKPGLRSDTIVYSKLRREHVEPEMDWPYEIAERDHDIQNPTSVEKLRLLGDYLRLGSESRVLDVACGKGGPAIVLASTYGCRIVGVELRDAFAEAARARVAGAGLDSLVDVHTDDAKAFALEPEGFDAALCLGASFVWGTIGDAAAALLPAVKPDGFVAVGEPYWRTWPLPQGIDADAYVDLASTAGRFAAAGVAVTGVIASTDDDWDRYESLHWRALEEWLVLHADAHEIRTQHERYRRDYLAFKRALLGWAIFVGRRS
jgi:RimJ/RimL family protein N-acetyltransferase/SAM-dependent methyltransferase